MTQRNFNQTLTSSKDQPVAISPHLVTQDDLVELTGTVQAAKQAEILDQHGIFYIRRRDAKIITTWHHVNHPCLPTFSPGSEPDFSSLE